MIPIGTHASVGYLNPQAADHSGPLPDGAPGLDTSTGGWSLNTTVHKKALCTHGRYGCMRKTKLWTDPDGFTYTLAAVNYDKYATYPTDCYFNIPGCLNKDALNTGCLTVGGTSKC